MEMSLKFHWNACWIFLSSYPQVRSKVSKVISAHSMCWTQVVLCRGRKICDHECDFGLPRPWIQKKWHTPWKNWRPAWRPVWLFGTLFGFERKVFFCGFVEVTLSSFLSRSNQCSVSKGSWELWLGSSFGGVTDIWISSEISRLVSLIWDRSWTTCDSLRFWMMVSRKILRVLCSPALDTWFFTGALWWSHCVILQNW